MDDYNDDYLDDDDDEDFPYDVMVHDDAPRISHNHAAISTNINRFGLPSNYRGANTALSSNGHGDGHPFPTAPQKPRSSATVMKDDVVLSVDDVKMAAMRNDVTVLTRALERGFPPDTPSQSDWTALMYAAHSGSAGAVRCLVEAGASARFHKDLYTVLMAACSSTCNDEQAVLECVDTLVTAGADVNAYDRHHVSALMYAAKEGRALVIRRLAQLGAELNKQDGRGYTALMWAVMRKRVQAVYTLLELGCHVHLRDRYGSTALDLAAMEGLTQIQTLLSKQGELGANDLQQAEQSVAKTEASYNQDTSMHFGDLEMVLSGLGLSDLIPAFHAHHVTFQQFLRMSDEELKPIVKQAGIRKRLLENIAKLHKKEWEVTSLSSTGTVQTSKLTCSEAIFIMQNLKKHTSYMASTVAYIRDHMLESVLSGAAEGAGAEQLQIHTTEARTNADILLRELGVLRDHVAEVSAKAPPPDLIGRDVTRKAPPPSRLRPALITTVTAAMVFILVFKRQSVSSLVSNTFLFLKN